MNEERKLLVTLEQKLTISKQHLEQMREAVKLLGQLVEEIESDLNKRQIAILKGEQS